MKNFPRNLTHGSGVMMTLDLSRLLLSFTQPHKQEDVESLIERFGLIVETGRNGDFERTTDRTLRQMNAVNNTTNDFWVRTKDNSEVNDELFNTIEQELAETLEWIGPVYRVGNTPGLGGLMCPIPNVLLIKQLADQEGERDSDISSAAAAVGTDLREIPEKSKYLSGYRYFIITDVRKQNSYQLREILQEKVNGLDVRFENMPMINPTAFVPNDTQYAQQWDMRQIQAGGAGTTGWDLSTGNNTVVICILDSGCDLTHPDLQFFGRGIDLGTMAGDGSPNGPDPRPAAHGTACAGIAASIINNNLGIAGVAGRCRIMPLALQRASDGEVAAGINYAADNGARVISISQRVYAAGVVGVGLAPVGIWDFTIIDPAIAHAVNVRGCVICAATGNENNGTVNGYPALHPLVIACGASDQSDNRKSPASPDGETWGSTFGTNTYLGQNTGVSVVAPGVLIPTTDRQGANGYNTAAGTAGDYTMRFNGTSSATPHVAGFAGLLRSLYSALTNNQVRDIIEKTAQKVGRVAYADQPGFPNGTRNQEMGYGRINVLRGLDFADVMIKDWWNDLGVEPSTPPSGNFWSFSDIVVRATDDASIVPEDPIRSSNVERGQTNYLYIRVTNKGPRAARNVVVSARITPFVGLQFVHPHDWTAIDAKHVSPTPVTATFATIPPGGSQLAKFTISSAQVDALWGWISGMRWHPCLLAEVHSGNDYAFDTASRTGGDLIVRRNNLAQRNLSVVDELAGATASFPIIAGNELNNERLMEIVVDRSQLREEMQLLLSLDDDIRAFPRIDLDNSQTDKQNDNAIVYLDRTKIEMTMGCCRGILTLEKGSRFDCPTLAKIKKINVKGGDVIIRNEKRYVDIKDNTTIIQMEKTPNQLYPLSLQIEIPKDSKARDRFTIDVSQRNGK